MWPRFGATLDSPLRDGRPSGRAADAVIDRVHIGASHKRLLVLRNAPAGRSVKTPSGRAPKTVLFENPINSALSACEPTRLTRFVR
jgi:hypothetical protein